ncbi:MAG: ABC-F family ATP-binding cassette domain-containing protein [Desulfobulbaceae bacterium]|jgi:ATP-binding cassette subfamily F protein 3|nr:ABC-F family ATP-binding cassette domain-containing protein [Desulfobulbaceae bacterium]
MITINNLSLQYGEKHIFRNVSNNINNKDRIGLVGVNGAGKSTLLKMIAGDTVTDPGIIQKSKADTTGYLPQEITGINLDETLYREAETAFSHLLEKQKELTAIHDSLGEVAPNSKGLDNLLERQGDLQQYLDSGDIFTMQSSIEKVLMGLGFRTSDFNSPCSTFSGGWLMRLMLAKQLLAKPSFLLLDEPTNHLDVQTLTWLEDFLKGYEGGLIIISHDRIFLDNLVTAIWEISLGNLTVYKGNYSKFVVEKEERQTITKSAYDNQQAKIEQTMRFVDRFRSKSTKAKQAQSRLKQLDKMDLIEIEDQETKISFRFPPSAPSGRNAVIIEKLEKSFGDKKIFAGLDLELERGDKLAIVGANGAGKSTLVKLLAGLDKPDGGVMRFGHNVIVSYFGQHQAQELNPELTVLETMNRMDMDKTVSQTRSLLGAFLFKGDDVDKKVGVLSGGEKSRLALARMIATPANLLIMDEPTNHLDMGSQDILMEAMNQYDGSIVVVSHNRFFLDRFTNKTLELKDGKATIYEGNISYYISKTQHKESNEVVEGKPALSKTSKPKGKKARQEQAKLRKNETQSLAPLKKEVQKLEAAIEKQEAGKSALEQCLADPKLYEDQAKFTEKSKEYAAAQKDLERTYGNWEAAQDKLEQAKQKLR